MSSLFWDGRRLGRKQTITKTDAARKMKPRGRILRGRKPTKIKGPVLKQINCTCVF